LKIKHGVNRQRRAQENQQYKGKAAWCGKEPQCPRRRYKEGGRKQVPCMSKNRNEVENRSEGKPGKTKILKVGQGEVT